jgi:hypothetical protein
MCAHCIDPGCDMGSLCHKGLFAAKDDSSFAPLAAGPHKQTQKSSLKGVYESEHMYPCAALKLSHPGAVPEEELL